MYELLHEFSSKPIPFSRYSAKELWTRPHLAAQMLSFHLNQETELASRPIAQIEPIVDWIDCKLQLSGKRLCDLGCGPGLYAERFAGKGSTVVGVDFSKMALNYAKSQNNGETSYIHADYLADDLPHGFDVITLIYTDLCALSPTQRYILLHRMKSMLKPQGHIVIDVAGTGGFADKQENTTIDDQLMGGFWAPGNYVGIQKTFLYPEISLSLDRFLIIEPDSTWQIFNWFQHFTPDQIEAELAEAGFEIEYIAGDLCGSPLDINPKMMGIIARMIDKNS